MKNEEAIRILANAIKKPNSKDGYIGQALTMAIKALEQWLKALKEIWDSGDCNDCRNGQCEWKPRLGQLVRFNCPHYVGVANNEVNADEEGSESE